MPAFLQPVSTFLCSRLSSQGASSSDPGQVKTWSRNSRNLYYSTAFWKQLEGTINCYAVTGRTCTAGCSYGKTGFRRKSCKICVGSSSSHFPLGEVPAKPNNVYGKISCPTEMLKKWERKPSEYSPIQPLPRENFIS